MAKNYSEAHHKAINKYRNKTYKAYNLVLRNEEDSDLIEAIETAKANKVTIRGWLRSVYESGYTELQGSNDPGDCQKNTCKHQEIGRKPISCIFR